LNTEDRIQAIQEIRINKDSSYLTLLIELLNDPNLDIRRHALIALEDIGDRQALDPILKLFVDEDELVRDYAASSLTPNFVEVALPRLLEIVKYSDNPIERETAVWALQEMDDDPRVIPAIIESTKDIYPNVRAIAVDVLGTNGNSEIVPILIERLKNDESSDVRWIAAEKLSCFPQASVIEALTEAVQTDTHADVRTYAAYSLGHVGNEAAIPHLEKLIQSPIRLEKDYAEWAIIARSHTLAAHRHRRR
jgi:HEAT repeat protein